MSAMDAPVMELEIGPGSEPGSYVTRVLHSVGGGEPTASFRLDVDELLDRRPLLEASVLASAVPARRVMADSEAIIQDVGRRLFDAAFTGDVATAYRTSMAVASERGLSVQVSLRLTAPGLAALPWETLYDPVTERYLCRKDPLVRNVPSPHVPALQVTRPLRVLGMISSPRGLVALDVDLERSRLEEALRAHLEDGRVELHWLDEVTWDALHAKLLESAWHVLHFVGHGTYDSATDEGVLAFVGRDGRPDYVTASALADLLDEAEPTPPLVVLNSCQSGASGPTDLFSGTAAALARSGIRAVAAMQFPISDPAALAFARGFYTALAHDRGVDEAVRSGRIGILGGGRGTLEWVTPVLYLRGDGHLFDLVGPAVGPPPEQRSPTPPDDDASPTAGSGTDTQRDAVPDAESVRGASAWRRWAIGGAVAALAIAAGAAIYAATTMAQGGGGTAGTDEGASGGSASTARLAVPLDIEWVDTGLYCLLGDEFVIEVTGRGWLDETAESQIGPEGLVDDASTDTRVLAEAGTGAVIGTLSTTPEVFAVGAGTTYECPAQGDLMLGINDTDLADNSGEFAAFVTLNQ